MGYERMVNLHFQTLYKHVADLATNGEIFGFLANINDNKKFYLSEL